MRKLLPHEEESIRDGCPAQNTSQALCRISMSTNGASVSQSPVIRHDRIYKNDGNRPLIALLDRDAHQVLDVGCGAGDNAELVQSLLPGCQVHGITPSGAESEIAKRRMPSC